MTLDLKSLIGKLDRDTRKVLEQAATVCVSQTHFDVEPEHLLLSLVKSRDAVVSALLSRYDIDPAALIAELEASLGKLKRGNSRTPAFSPRVPEMMESALLFSLGVLEMPSIAMATLLVAPLEKDPLRAIILEAAPLLGRINWSEAQQLLPSLVLKRPEKKLPQFPSLTETAQQPAPAGEAGSMDRYTIDLTAMAKKGELDPVIGRDREIRQLIDVMMRRRQNNPILVGDPGVGKTAIVEGLALRIAAGDVPPMLKAMSVRSLDLGLLQAGAGVKGEFEERLKKLIAEVASQPNQTVIFIDEAHALIGAGGAAGQGDAANLLKPALARGQFRTIAATTWGEYKRHFEKDPALARRFQPIKVGEPDEEAARNMLRGLVARLESHHGIRILDDAVGAAVSLSARYIPARQLPDKAISVLDTACARVAIGRNIVPEALETIDREIETLKVEAGILERQPGGGEPGRIEEINRRLSEAALERETLAETWKAELALTKRLDDALAAGETAEAVRKLRAELAELQGDAPLVSWCVDQHVVASVISEWTGIPVGSMTEDDAATVRRLDELLGERILGQPQAITAIARAIRGYRAGLGEPGRPVGVFLLCGPSGVGKTGTAIALADLLYGGDASLITLNMSEYQEAHAVATLRGAPPGYVGYGSGGVLTEAVRRRPYSVVLLDEIEKAHPDILEIFYQVFDKGVLEDGEGIEVDFKNTLILLTGNLAEEELVTHARGLRARGSDPEKLLEVAVEMIGPVLRRTLRPAFLGRLTVVPYLPLEEEHIRGIVEMQCERIALRLADRQGRRLVFTPEAREEIVRRSLASDTGARTIDQVLHGTVIPGVAAFVLDALAGGEATGQITVDVEDGLRLVCRRDAA